MSYVRQSLGENERVLFQGRFPLIYWLLAWAALFVLGVVGIGVIIFAWAAIHMTTTEFAVTDQRVVLKRGWISRRTWEIALNRVESAELNQSILGRIFGFGVVTLSGTGEAEVRFPPMAHPIAFRRAIITARRDE